MTPTHSRACPSTERPGVPRPAPFPAGVNPGAPPFPVLSRNRPLRRGTAEIELILSVTIFITLLMLALGAMRIAAARLSTSRTAAFEAFQNATTGQTPEYTGDGDLPPVDGIDSVHPGLPNRTHVPKPTRDVTVNTGKSADQQSFPPVTVGGKAGLAGPPWTYPAYPVGGQDESDTRKWFLEDTAESHTYLTDSLRLAPAWEP